MHIRRGTAADFAVLRETERAAGELFRPLGMDTVADDDPPSPEFLRAFEESDGLWVLAEDGAAGVREYAEGAPAGEDAGRPVAYALLEPLDGAVHIEQITVHPEYAHRRLGRALIEHAAARAAQDRATALTLTTFAGVPWNAPYYLRCGFRVLEERELTAGLRKIRAQEAEAGLDRWPRVCMRRELPAS